MNKTTALHVHHLFLVHFSTSTTQPYMYTPGMTTHGSVVSRAVKIFISAFFAGSFVRNDILRGHPSRAKI